MAGLWGVFVNDSAAFGVYFKEVLFRSGLLQLGGGGPGARPVFTV